METTGEKNRTSRYLFSRAKEPGTPPPASGIKDSLTPGLAQDSGPTLCPPPSPPSSNGLMGLGIAGGFREKKDHLSIGINIAFLKKNFFFYFKPSHNSNVSLIIFCRGKKLITQRNIKH